MYTVFHFLKLKSKISRSSEGVRSSDHVRSNRFLIGLNFLLTDRLYLAWKIFQISGSDIWISGSDIWIRYLDIRNLDIRYLEYKLGHGR